MAAQKPPPDGTAAGPDPSGQPQGQGMGGDPWHVPGSEPSSDRVWGEEEPGAERQRGLVAVPDGGSNPVRPAAAYSAFETDDNVWIEPGHPVGASSPVDASSDSRQGQSAQSAALEAPQHGGTPNRAQTNPFKRKPVNAASTTSAPTPPTLAFTQLSVNETGINPWQPTLDDKRPDSRPAKIPEPAPGSFSSRDIWDSGKPLRQPSPNLPTPSPGLMSLPSEEGSAGWDEESYGKAPSPSLHAPAPAREDFDDSHAWDDLGALDKGKAPAEPPAVRSAAPSQPIDDWNLIDVDAPPPPGPPSTRSTWENFEDPEDAPPAVAAEESHGEPPGLPPRRTTQDPPPQPPRLPASETTGTYQVKNITWYDITAAKNPRTSPILVQNANGPCPLVALVNALSLTTPPETETTLVEALRTREQVSLALLLDAVFDELMSPSRNSPDTSLPDMSELYAFLQGLHTGMNVNPRFVPTPEVITAHKRTSLTHLHPTERGDVIPGSFEDTREMRLYAVFSIPLIHGWLPQQSDPAYQALARRAPSYEDAQNLLFREEELEERLSGDSEQGLTEEEQGVYQDILNIRSFLSSSATQLTPWGLDVIRKAMNPGSVAILFRNDHFSTLYRHPQTLELLSLVTDEGYAGHAEVVWESLVDVRGERAEFLSGDFRIVGGPSQYQQTGQPSSSARGSGPGGLGGGCAAGQGRGGRSQQPEADARGEPPLSPKHEQEDRDLALALQLQEEEEERHRAQQARRQRESMLSEQVTEPRTQQPAGNGRRTHSQANGRGGLLAATTPSQRSSSSTGIPASAAGGGEGHARGGGSTRSRGGGAQQNVRSLIPPRGQAVSRPADEGLDDAPPSYEQASRQSPFIPSQGHPSHTASTSRASLASGVGSRTPSQSRPQPLIDAAGPSHGTPNPPTGQYRAGVPLSPSAGPAMNSERDKDCTVM